MKESLVAIAYLFVLVVLFTWLIFKTAWKIAFATYRMIEFIVLYIKRIRNEKQNDLQSTKAI